MALKKLAVCGCSFMTTSAHNYKIVKGANWPNFPVTDDAWRAVSESIKNEMVKFNYIHNPSFLDLFCEEKGFEQINLAVGGSSNLNIREQITSAVKLNPDYVIVGATEWIRFDFADDNKDSLAYKYFLAELYNDNAKKLSDYYIIQSGLNLLEKHNIPYVFIPGPLNDLDWSKFQTVWPSNIAEPWDRYVLDPAIANHIAFDDHKDLCKALLKITENWK